jgi:hypothetical protein
MFANDDERDQFLERQHRVGQIYRDLTALHPTWPREQVERIARERVERREKDWSNSVDGWIEFREWVEAGYPQSPIDVILALRHRGRSELAREVGARVLRSKPSAKERVPFILDQVDELWEVVKD